MGGAGLRDSIRVTGESFIGLQVYMVVSPK